MNLSLLKNTAGFQAQDYRASIAHAARREQAGGVVVRCAWCRTELDVALVVHIPRCKAAL